MRSLQLWQSRLRAESSCVTAPGCRPPSLLACNAVVLLCSGGSRPPDSAMPGPSTAKQARGPTRREIAQSRLAPAARQRPRPSPPSGRAVRTCPCRRGSPRGRLSGQKLSCGSWNIPSGGDASQKLVWLRTAPAQLALPASRCCTELRPSQGRILGQNKLTKCRNLTMSRILKSVVHSER